MTCLRKSVGRCWRVGRRCGRRPGRTWNVAEDGPLWPPDGLGHWAEIPGESRMPESSSSQDNFRQGPVGEPSSTCAAEARLRGRRSALPTSSSQRFEFWRRRRTLADSRSRRSSSSLESFNASTALIALPTCSISARQVPMPGEKTAVPVTKSETRRVSCVQNLKSENPLYNITLNISLERCGKRSGRMSTTAPLNLCPDL